MAIRFEKEIPMYIEYDASDNYLNSFKGLRIQNYGRNNSVLLDDQLINNSKLNILIRFSGHNS